MHPYTGNPFIKSKNHLDTENTVIPSIMLNKNKKMYTECYRKLFLNCTLLNIS